MSGNVPAVLRLPDGARLPARDEIKGPRGERDRLWARVERARLRPGFVVRATESAEFGAFIEANVDADRLGAVFADLARAVFGARSGAGSDAERSDEPDEEPLCRLLLADAEEELTPVGEARLERILGVLAAYPDPLFHDGWIHFGLVRERPEGVSAVLVTPTKHLQIWARTPETALSILTAAGLEADVALEFLADYPVIAGLPEGRASVGVEELRSVFAEQLTGPGA